MTLEEFQALDIREGDRVMLFYKEMPSFAPIKTLITIRKIAISDKSFTLANMRSQYQGHRIEGIEKYDAI